ncbi:MAG: DUF2807 domain-containing protein [Bacteroidetes bacterium]|nr:MAG: DUF2807 domain-containing protein [Bacteroidota bacterium]
MKTFFSLSPLLIMLLVAMSSSGCDQLNICENGRGSTLEESLDMASFSGIDLRTNANVYLIAGDSQSVSVQAQENVFEALDFEVVDSVLVIDLNKCFYSYDMDVYLTLDQPLSSVEVSGSGDVFTLEKVDVASLLSLEVSGSGEISLEADADQIENRISGSGGMNLSGSANSIETRLSSSGSLDGYSMTTQDQKVMVTGSGKAKVHVEGGTLDVTISGSGTVYYRGTPGSVNTSVTGSGRLVDDN